MALGGLRDALRRLFMPASVKRMLALGDLITGSWVAQGVAVAARLGVADHIGDEPVSVGTLARAVGADEAALYRLLRMLAAEGLFIECSARAELGVAARRFALTQLGRLLRSDHPDSMRGFARYQGERWHWQSWGELEESVRTGRPSTALGAPLFEFLRTHPEAAAVFDGAMADLSNARDLSAISGYDFARFRTVVDVGGGNGRLVRSVLKAYPSVAGMLYDLPEVIERARPLVTADGLASRCRLESGSFFDAVPYGGDAYMLKQVLHDWPDDKAIAILRNCRAALGPAGAVLIFEFVVPDDDSRALAKLSDLEMLVITGGRERTLGEYEQLLEAAGLRLNKTYETRSPFTIIEAGAG